MSDGLTAREKMRLHFIEIINQMTDEECERFMQLLEGRSDLRNL